MAFKIDEKDVNFCLFEWLDLNKLLAFDAYKDQSLDLYKMVLGEGIKFRRRYQVRFAQT